MELFKKITKKSLLLILGLSTLYTGAWFASKYYVDYKIEDYFNLMSSSKDIKSITYKSDIGCFPKMCATINNVKIATEKGYLDNPAGLNIEIFGKYPLIYKTSNIFYPRVKFTEANSKFDFTVSSAAEESTPIILEVYLNNLDIDISKNQSLFAADKIALMASANNSALTSIIDTNNFKVEYNEKDKINSSLKVNVTDFKKYNGYGKIIKTVNHLYADLATVNFNKEVILKSLQALKEAKTFEEKANFMEAAINNIIENKSELKIKDFKLTDDQLQIISKGVATINKDSYIVGKLAIAAKFLTEHSPFEQILKASKVKKGETGSYNIEIVLTEKGGFFNSNLFMPPLNLKRVETPKEKNTNQGVTLSK